MRQMKLLKCGCCNPTIRGLSNSAKRWLCEAEKEREIKVEVIFKVGAEERALCTAGSLPPLASSVTAIELSFQRW